MPSCDVCQCQLTPDQVKSSQNTFGKNLCPAHFKEENDKNPGDALLPADVKVRPYLERNGFSEQSMKPGFWIKGETPNRRFVDFNKMQGGMPEIGVLNGLERVTEGITELATVERDIKNILKTPENSNTGKNTPAKSAESLLPASAYLEDDLLKKVTFQKVMLMAQRTDPAFVQTRPSRGGGHVSYVKGDYMKQVMNLATGWKWSSKIDSFKETENEVICWGSVTITLPDGNTQTQSAVGSADIKLKRGTQTPVCLGDDYKAAVTDMKKKAISEWGIAHDVYSGEVSS